LATLEEGVCAVRLLEWEDDVGDGRQLEREQCARGGAKAVAIQVLRRVAGQRDRLDEAPRVERDFSAAHRADETVPAPAAKRLDQRREQTPDDDIEDA